MNRVSADLYGGIAGADLEPLEFPLPGGVVLSRTYAHLMAHFILAFKRPAPGSPHPAPWKSANAGLSFDVEVEIRVPGDLALDEWFDPLNTIWCSLGESKGDARVRVLETQQRALVEEVVMPVRISTADLEWLALRWLSGGRLYREHANFANAFVGFDQSIWTSAYGLGLVQLWGAFELLFATSRYRKTMQLGSRISAYLEPPGESREALKKQVENLYDSRSDAAHGNPIGQEESFFASYSLLKRVILKILEEDYVLTIGDLERLSQPSAEHRVH